MARSLKKGPYVSSKLVKKINVLKELGKKQPVKTWSRRSMITPDFCWSNIFWCIMGINLFQCLWLKTWLVTS